VRLCQVKKSAKQIFSILNRWTLIEKNTNIPKDDLIGAIKLILSSTYFTFNNKIYRQTFGSPLSPIIANLVLQDLEERALEKKFIAIFRVILYR